MDGARLEIPTKQRHIEVSEWHSVLNSCTRMDLISRSPELTVLWVVSATFTQQIVEKAETMTRTDKNTDKDKDKVAENVCARFKLIDSAIGKFYDLEGFNVGGQDW